MKKPWMTGSKGSINGRTICFFHGVGCKKRGVGELASLTCNQHCWQTTSASWAQAVEQANRFRLRSADSHACATGGGLYITGCSFEKIHCACAAWDDVLKHKYLSYAVATFSCRYSCSPALLGMEPLRGIEHAHVSHGQNSLYTA